MKVDPRIKYLLLFIMLFIALLILITQTGCALVYPKQSLPNETKYQKAVRLCEQRANNCECFDSVMRSPTFKPKFKPKYSLTH